MLRVQFAPVGMPALPTYGAPPPKLVPSSHANVQLTSVAQDPLLTAIESATINGGSDGDGEEGGSAGGGAT